MASEHLSTLEALIEENRAVVREFVHVAGILTPEQWDTARAPDKWSPAQETSHVIASYRGFAREVREGPEVNPSTFQTRLPELRQTVLPRILLGNWFPNGGRSPAGARPAERPGAQDSLLAALASSAVEFETAMRGAAVAQPDRYVRHPFFGALTLGELIRVVVEHTRHHLGFLPGAVR